jgi:DNA-binding NarL/FixJ family response regulator
MNGEGAAARFVIEGRGGVIELLTRTEEDIRPYLPVWRSPVDIADIRGVAVTMVRTHVRNIQRKLHATNRA